jgi:hypothetical protein
VFEDEVWARTTATLTNALVELNYLRLNRAERHRLGHLAVQPGAATLAAVEAILSVDDGDEVHLPCRTF